MPEEWDCDDSIIELFGREETFDWPSPSGSLATVSLMLHADAPLFLHLMQKACACSSLVWTGFGVPCRPASR